ncbi:MAG: hydrogenase maturation protease [Anaerolineales bacterium]|nr:hydrogenase maturation protease [Anaerolineales bacterium]
MIFPCAPSGEILVLGVGNPLCGDDGLGPCAIEMLAGAPASAGLTHAHLQDAGLPGWGLPSWFQGWQRVILIDAVELGQSPGFWRRFQPEDVQLWLQDEHLSLHQPDLACGLALAQALDMLPEQLFIYGMQPADTTPGAPLSPQVRARLPEMIDHLIAELNSTAIQDKI